MGKNYHLELSLLDTGSFVKARIGDAERVLIDYENSEARPVRVRAPLPGPKGLIENLKYWVDTGHQNTIEESVEFYIHCREKEVFDQVQEIRKAIKRISRSMECIKIAREEFSRLQATDTQ
ncbi:MAG: hypothetical protein WAW41_05395 [Methylobacter sp.]